MENYCQYGNCMREAFMWVKHKKEEVCFCSDEHMKKFFEDEKSNESQ